jgi:hypothetical protein
MPFVKTVVPYIPYLIIVFPMMWGLKFDWWYFALDFPLAYLTCTSRSLIYLTSSPRFRDLFLLCQIDRQENSTPRHLAFYHRPPTSSGPHPRNLRLLLHPLLSVLLSSSSFFLFFILIIIIIIIIFFFFF